MVWCRRQDSNPGHIGGRRVLSPPRHPCSDYRKCMEELRFLKSNKGLLCTPDLMCSFFKLISYIFQRETDKYIQLARIKWLYCHTNICPDYPGCPHNHKGVYYYWIVLIFIYNWVDTKVSICKVLPNETTIVESANFILLWLWWLIILLLLSF